MNDASASPSKPMESSSIIATTVGLAVEAETILVENRDLNPEILASLGWRSSRNASVGNGWPVEIPYLVDGIEVNTKTRTIMGEKKFYQVAGGQKVLYNHQVIETWQQSPTGSLLICEGEIDCVTAIQCGYLAVSVPDGAPAQAVGANEHSAKYTYLEGFPTTGTVIICADGDAAGANLLRDLTDRLGKHRVKWIGYPKGCKDLNEVLMKYGQEGVHKTIQRARWMEVHGVYKMSELPPSPPHEPMACEIIPINLRTCELSVWTGHAGFGKSTLTNYISSLAVEDRPATEHVPARLGWHVSVASFEQEPQTEHRDALRTIYMGMRPKYASQAHIEEADRWIDKRYTFIVPNDETILAETKDADLSWLFEMMATAVTRYGTKLFIIDPWNELDHAFDRREMNDTQYTGFAIKQLKKFAKRYRVHIAVIAHPAKMKPGKGGKKMIPNAHDIADSAHWSNKPDLIVVVHRKDGKTLVRIEKSRYQEEDKIGPAGDYFLEYDDATKAFTIADASAASYSHAEAKPLLDKDDPNPNPPKGKKPNATA